MRPTTIKCCSCPAGLGNLPSKNRRQVSRASSAAVRWVREKCWRSSSSSKYLSARQDTEAANSIVQGPYLVAADASVPLCKGANACSLKALSQVENRFSHSAQKERDFQSILGAYIGSSVSSYWTTGIRLPLMNEPWHYVAEPQLIQTMTQGTDFTHKAMRSV
jgi:hypothetical protein